MHNDTTAVPVVTIDGPSGSGKGTVSQLLAKRLGWHYLDSGSVYRVLALMLRKREVELSDISAIVTTAKTLDAKIAHQIISAQVDIRSEECGTIASKIATIPAVRSALLTFLHTFSKLPGLIADGRDMGTVVFPHAQLKVFLTASIAARAKRRLLQLQSGGINATLSVVLQGLRERDMRDEKRAIAPLKPDPTAVIIDTTKLNIDEVLQVVLDHVHNMAF